MNLVRALSLILCQMAASGIARADGETPAWFEHQERCLNCFYGSSQPSETENSAAAGAISNAYMNLAIAEFGMGVHITETQEVTNSGTTFEQQITQAMDLRSIPGKTLKKSIVRGSSGEYVAYVELQFASTDIKEAKRQRSVLAAQAFSSRLQSITVPKMVGRQSEVYGELIIRGVPSTARSFLDDNFIGSGEGFYPRVGIGTYRLTIVDEARRYHDLSAAVQIEPGKRTFLEVALEPKEGELVVESTPGYARVSVDNRFIGLTPAKVRLGYGVHSVEVTKEGRAPKTFTAAVDFDEQLKFTVHLEKLQPKVAH